MKLLSIIVPMYKSEAYLPKCLDSLLDQDISHEDYEIVLIDDGSPDGGKALAEGYASRYQNIVVLSQDNKGTSGARNTGLRYASGKYVYFVDPDDYILGNSLKEILQKMEDESLDVLRFGYYEVDEDYHFTKSAKHFQEPDYSSRIMDGYTFMGERLGVACYVWTYLFRLSLIKDNELFFIEGDYFDDTPWLPKVLAHAKRVDSVDWKRHFYLIRSNSLVQSISTNNVQRKIDGQLFLIAEMQRQMEDVLNRDAISWYKMMISFCVLTLLSLVSMHRFADRQVFFKRLREKCVYPLSMKKLSGNNRIKAAIINISPEIYCRLIHIIRL